MVDVEWCCCCVVVAEAMQVQASLLMFMRLEVVAEVIIGLSEMDVATYMRW